jgi:RNA recognition motif-containing protein
LKRCGIHWDNLGNSKGTADVEFEKPEDAKKAIDEYNSMSFKLSF